MGSFTSVLHAAVLKVRICCIARKRSMHLGAMLDNSSTKYTCKFCRCYLISSLETSALNDPQNDIENYKVNASLMRFWFPPEYQSSIRFTLRPAIFELQTNWTQEHRMTQNDLDHYQVKRTPYILCIYIIYIVHIYKSYIALY